MYKKGFTLIELLAVIVILAIIAVIAVPIVINIIDDSKKNSTLRSGDFYLDAVEHSIAQATLKGQNIKAGTYSIMNDGNICLETYDKTAKTCKDKEGKEDNDKYVLKVEVNGEVPKAGKIAISGGEILHSEIKLNEKEIIKDSRGEIAYAKTLEEVCTYVKEDNTTPKTAGAKYNCKVDPNKDPYTFYVLTTPEEDDTNINLIMDRNICSDGTLATSTNKCLVAWISTEKYYEDVGGVIPDEILNDAGQCKDEGICSFNDKGPLTAMEYLSNGTKNWTNTNEMIVDKFTDDRGFTHDMQAYNTYARMPHYSEVSNYDSANKTNAYLYDYLNSYNNIQTNEINGIYGYWTLSSGTVSSPSACDVYHYGFVDIDYGVEYDSGYGVRAFINLKI